jgi:uncharacterized membrane protein YdjX (TVP38/TMEM64 family)
MTQPTPHGQHLSSTPHLIKSLGPAGPLAIISMTLPALGGFLLLGYLSSVGNWLKSHGSEGTLIYIAGFALAAGLCLLPTYSLAILGGWVFGMAGFPAALAGFLGGAVIGYFTGRAASGNRVEQLLQRKPEWLVVRDALVGSAQARNPLKTLFIVSLLRLPPNSPFAVTNLLLSSVGVPFWLYLLGTAIGMAPRTAALVYFASRLQSDIFDPAQAKQPKWMIVVGIVLLLGVFAVLSHIAKNALAAATARPNSAAPSEPAPRDDR